MKDTYKVVIMVVIVFAILSLIMGRMLHIQWQAEVYQKNLSQQKYEELQNKVDNFFGEYKRMRKYFK